MFKQSSVPVKELSAIVPPRKFNILKTNNSPITIASLDQFKQIRKQKLVVNYLTIILRARVFYERIVNEA